MSRLAAPSRWSMFGPGRLPDREQACRWLARLLWVVTLLQVGLGFYLTRLNHLSLERLFSEFVMSQALATLAFVTVGTLIITRRPGNMIGWLFCVVGVASGITTWIGQYVRYTMVTEPGALPAGEFVTWIYFWSWIPLMATVVVYLPLVFPNGHLPSRRWRPVLWLAGVTTIMVSLNLAISPGPIDAALPEVTNPYTPEDLNARLERYDVVLLPVGILLVAACLAAALAAPVVRFRHARGDERQQIKWFAYATALLIAAFAGPALISPADFANPDGDTLLSGVLLSIGLPCLPIAIGFAILRYRLYDIDVIINRTLVYGALTAILLFTYLMSVFAFGSVLRSFTGGSSQLVVVASTLAVAALFRPLRSRIQHVIDQRFYRTRYDAARTLADFSARLRGEIDLNTLSHDLQTVVADTMQPAHVSLWLRGHTHTSRTDE